MWMTFVLVNKKNLEELKQKLIEGSVLNLTIELNKKNSLPFLDINVGIKDNKFHTSIYRNPQMQECV